MPASTQARAQRTLLTKQRYADLLNDVQQLVVKANAAVDEHKVAAQWNLGRRITRERVDTDSGYHNAILRDLAADARLSIRTLQYAVAFHAAYPRSPKLPLGWLHYRTLLDCRDAEARDRYATLAVKQRLTARELARLIASDRNDTAANDALPRPVEANYIYRAKVAQVIDGDTLDLSIDLGFHTDRRGRFRLADIDCPELPSQPARRARDYVIQRLLTAKTIVVKTQRTDVHGRYVAHLFYSSADIPNADCFHNGTYLNAELINASHAVRA